MSIADNKLKKKDIIYRIILFVFAMMICIVSLTDVSFISMLNVREIGMIAFLFVDVLYLVQMISERDRKKKGVFKFIYACIGTIVYMMYCRDVFFRTIPGTTDDALYIAGILCVLFVFMKGKNE